MAKHTPTDRGYAVIFENDEGTNVGVCTAIANGTPSDLFAVHTRMASIKIEEGITFSTVGRLRISNRPVAVVGEEDVVHIRSTTPAAARNIAVLPS
ncbi:hypothetical protein [Dactylosporangium sp. CA-139066]|uniref:hypothetical protein n=1 Tax=Dactylosporangium sp. CA-139066 TaxID=3239930 RepID=UPI003D8A5E34